MYTIHNPDQVQVLRTPVRRNWHISDLNEWRSRLRAVGKLLEDMTGIMDGMGMAGPQLGHQLPVIYVHGIGVMIDPVITSKEGEINTVEGCLSIPGGTFGQLVLKQTFKVKRASKITVKYFNDNLEEKVLTLDAESHYNEVICIQHEVDHLDGILIDRK